MNRRVRGLWRKEALFAYFVFHRQRLLTPSCVFILHASNLSEADLPLQCRLQAIDDSACARIDLLPRLLRRKPVRPIDFGNLDPAA